MRFSPDGQHLLGGQGSGGVYLDGKIIADHAGGWDWVASDQMVGGAACAGPGGFDITPKGILEAYNLATGVNSLVEQPWTATRFYGQPGVWLAYLADGHTYSWDYVSRTFPGKVALAVSPALEYVFGDDGGKTLYVRRRYGNSWTTPVTIQTWNQLPSGWWYSPDYRGCYFGDVWYACGYLAAKNGLCVWQPFDATAPVWLLSTALDYNPDIALRISDSMIVVGSGQNAGETAQNLYELNLFTKQFRKNGGPWENLHG